jgi:hypothetical protein
MWVPYDCYMKLYTKTEFCEAAEATNLTHLLVTGDSQHREVFASLLVLFGLPSRSKYNKREMVLSCESEPRSIRATYLDYSATYRVRDPETTRLYEFDRHYFEHYRLLSTNVGMVVWETVVKTDSWNLSCFLCWRSDVGTARRVCGWRRLRALSRRSRTAYSRSFRNICCVDDIISSEHVVPRKLGL